MAAQQEQAPNKPGLPRANANGLFLLALIVLSIFGVMVYSCKRERKNNTPMFDSPPHPLSGNEWFIGKAKGIELPTAPTPIPQTPTVQVVTQTVRTPTAPKNPPSKRLGGNVFSDKSNQRETQGHQQELDSPPIDNFASFELRARSTQTQFSRPEYYLKRDVELSVSDFEIKAGTTISAQLDMAINSDLGGPAVAHITRTIYDTVTGGFPLLPPGTKLYGMVDPNVSFGQTRIDIVWERLIFPNGASLVVENMRASDKSGQVGLHHSVDNHFVRLFGGALLLSAISSGIQLSQPQQSVDFERAPSIGQTLASALGQNLGQVSTEFVHRELNIKPTIIIPSGEHFTVIVNKDMVLPGPYGTWD